MISNIVKYGGLFGKVKAMYGNRLTAADYEQMSTADSIPAVAQYLQNHPSWSDALSTVRNTDSRFLNRQELERLLRRGQLLEYEKLLRFLQADDRRLVKSLVYLSDAYVIGSFLRHLYAPVSGEFLIDLPSFYTQGSKINFERLRVADSFDAMLSAVEKAPYSAALERLRPAPGEEPDYASIDIAIRTSCYRSFFALAKHGFSGRERRLIESAVGAEIDLYNIVTVFRLKKSFPGSLDDVFQFLMPFNSRLRPDTLRALYHARDMSDAMDIVSKTPYGEAFSARQLLYIEEAQYEYMYKMARKLLRDAIPSLYTALAYLIIKDVELRNIVHVIECVRYGLGAQDARRFLIGVS